MLLCLQERSHSSSRSDRCSRAKADRTTTESGQRTRSTLPERTATLSWSRARLRQPKPTPCSRSDAMQTTTIASTSRRASSSARRESEDQSETCSRRLTIRRYIDTGVSVTIHPPEMYYLKPRVVILRCLVVGSYDTLNDGTPRPCR